MYRQHCKDHKHLRNPCTTAMEVHWILATSSGTIVWTYSKKAWCNRRLRWRRGSARPPRCICTPGTRPMGDRMECWAGTGGTSRLRDKVHYSIVYVLAAHITHTDHKRHAQLHTLEKVESERYKMVGTHFEAWWILVSIGPAPLLLAI